MQLLDENYLENTSLSYEISVKTIKKITILPFFIILVFSSLIIFPATREVGLKLLQENNLVEILTFLFLFVSGIKGLLLISYCKKKRILKKWELIFYLLFSLGLLLVAMEEIAWGQWFFRFDTPAFWKEINMQGETTIHNLRGIQGHSEVLKLIFTLGGIIGIIVSKNLNFRKIGVPPILLSYFIIIFILASLDLYNDYFPSNPRVDAGVSKLSEVVEMLIGISAFLYLWLNEKRIKALGVKRF